MIQLSREPRHVLESEQLRLVIHPSFGGKISSLFYKPREVELLSSEPCPSELESPYDRAFESGWLGGWDECLPSIAPRRHPDAAWRDVTIPDHGEVWSLPWTTEDAGPLWGELHRTLMKAGADATQTMRVIAARDLDELGHLIARLKGEEQAVVEAEPEPLPEIDNETKRQAMKTFRRRMKLLRLDRESKLGVGPLTTGKTADFDSMQAPHDFPDEVWRVLVAEGQLKDVGDGFYALP